MSPSLQQTDPQPKTSEELKEWIKEYDGGMKNHGEPNLLWVRNPLTAKKRTTLNSLCIK